MTTVKMEEASGLLLSADKKRATRLHSQAEKKNIQMSYFPAYYAKLHVKKSVIITQWFNLDFVLNCLLDVFMFSISGGVANAY